MAANRHERSKKSKNTNRGASYLTYGNVAYEMQPDYTPYYTDEEEEKAVKEQIRIEMAEKRENRILSVKAVLMILVVFAGCIAFMSIHVVVANANLELRQQKTKLADLKATNTILSAEITEQMDMDYIKEQATTRLGMAEPQPYQIVYIDVPKQSYTVQYAADAEVEKKSILEKISNILKKD